MTSAAGAGARQGILSLVLKDKAALYAAYMPQVKGGGIFVPTPKRYALGDEVFVLLSLPESSDISFRVFPAPDLLTPALRDKS